MERIKENIGFEGRVFLSEEEWMTYRRRKPVRFIRKKKPDVCEICKKSPTSDNPLENAHQIGFRVGVIYLGLTPEYVDSDENIVTAHKRKCNKGAELDLQGACLKLKQNGITKLPSYLPEFIHKIWCQTKKA